MGGYCKCKSCGRPITFVETPNGKYMPCDTKTVFYLPDEEGPDKIVTGDGYVIACTILPGATHGALVGLLPHWASCPKAGQHRGKSALPKPAIAPQRTEKPEVKAVQMEFREMLR